MNSQSTSRLRPSAPLIEALVEAVGAPAMVIEVGGEPGCRVVACNSRWIAAAGLVGAVPAGAALERVLPESAAAAFEADLARAAAGDTVEREDTIDLPAGQRRWRTVIAPLPAAAGPGMVMLTVTDMTAARQVEQAARAHDRRFQAIVTQLPVGVSLKDRDGRYTLINPQQAAWFGIDPAAAVGRLPTEVLPPENGMRAERRDDAVLEEGRTIRAEFRTPIADGSVRDFLIVSFPVLDDGVVIGAGTLMIDNTSLKNVERALQLSEDRFRDFAETAADWLWETDMDQRITYIGGGRLLTDRRSVLGHTRRELIEHLGGDGAVTDRIAALMAEGLRLENLVYQVRGLDGAPVFIRLRGKPLFDGNGGIVGYRGTSADVTAQHRTAVAMRQAMEHAESANRSKSEFLANMSHELRTPLNAIIGFSESLESGVFGSLPPRQHEYVRDIRASGQLLLAIINDILDIAKIEAGKAELFEDDVHVPALVEAALKLTRPQAEAQGLRVEVDLAPDLPMVRLDAQRMQQVLLNLLSNAVKFTEAPGTVSVAASVDGDGLVLVVGDTGIGIADRDIPKVFAPFGQVDGHLSRRHAGTGLGLPLAKALVDLHGGTLGLDSSPGRGTVVTVRLPAARLLAGG